jgi:hypothetical protein
MFSRVVIYEKGSQEDALPLAALFVPPLTYFLPPVPPLQAIFYLRCASVTFPFHYSFIVNFVFSHLFWLS